MAGAHTPFELGYGLCMVGNCTVCITHDGGGTKFIEPGNACIPTGHAGLLWPGENQPRLSWSRLNIIMGEKL